MKVVYFKFGPFRIVDRPKQKNVLYLPCTYQICIHIYITLQNRNIQKVSFSHFTVAPETEYISGELRKNFTTEWYKWSG